MVVVEDCPELLYLLQAKLRKIPNVACVGTYARASEALNAISPANAPDVVLLDLRLPGLISGQDMIPRLKRISPLTRVLVLSEDDRRETILETVSLGAAGYWLKASALPNLAAAIESVLAGGVSLGPHAQQVLANNLAERARLVARLSPTERRIENELANGVPYKDLADRLDISSSTLRTHARAILQKSLARNSREALENQRSFW